MKTGGNKLTEKKAGFLRVTDDAVRAETGKGWEEWFTMLDTCGAKENAHTKNARYLLKRYWLSPWWAQAAIIRYEWERGLRK